MDFFVFLLSEILTSPASFDINLSPLGSNLLLNNVLMFRFERAGGGSDCFGNIASSD